MVRALPVLIRLVGLVALFWSCWLLAALCFVLLGVVFNKPNKARIVFEVVVFIPAIAGMWFFPLVPTNVAHTTAIIAAILIILELGGPLVDRATDNMNRR